METYEECLREAAECARLAGLANTHATRTIMTVIAFKWRKLAEMAAEREKSNQRPDSGTDVSTLLNVGRS